MQPGDQVAVLFGRKLPFIVRKKEWYCQLVWDCYIHETMNGEAI